MIMIDMIIITSNNFPVSLRVERQSVESSGNIE